MFLEQRRTNASDSDSDCVPMFSPSCSLRHCVVLSRAVQLDGAVDEVFLNVTPLHKAEPYIQRELKKLQTSVRHGETAAC